MNELDIKNKIYTIRGFQVMLDRNLAELYGVETRALNQAVKRNIERFPEKFMFQLNEDELKILRYESNKNWISQNVIPNRNKMSLRIKPYAFTEQGVAMLSGILKSDTAIKTSIQIINAFVVMRHFIASNAQIFTRLDKVEKKQIEYDNKFNKIFDAIENNEVKQGIFYDGQIFDAYKFVSDLIRNAKKSIVLIDNFVDDSVLTLFSKSCVETTIFTKNISKQLKLDLEKYNLQYKPITIKEFKNSHDRFMIIDNKQVYHIGASLKDLGKKWFIANVLQCLKISDFYCAFSRFDKEALTILEKLG